MSLRFKLDDYASVQRDGYTLAVILLSSIPDKARAIRLILLCVTLRTGGGRLPAMESVIFATPPTFNAAPCRYIGIVNAFTSQSAPEYPSVENADSCGSLLDKITY